MPHPDRLPLFHVIGFVGQDPLPNPVGLDAVLRRTLAELPRESDVEWLALSAATGEADRRFADAAQNGGLGWEAVLPNHPNDLGVRLGAADRQAFETILPLAEHTRIVGEHPTPESGAFDCGLEIVNHCDLLLAVWDGRGDGAGTAAVVRYAREAGRPLIQIDPVTFAQTRERLERLKLGDRHVRQLNTMPAGPAEAADASDADPHQATVRAFQRKVDHAATHHAPHFRRLTTITVGLHVLATALAAAGLAFDLHAAVLPWGKLSCLLGAVGVAMVLRRQREHHDWVRCRLAAEIARGMLATWGLPRGPRARDDSDWAGLAPLQRSLDILQRRAARARPMAFADFKQRYLTERIDGQLAYFVRQESKATPLLRRLRAGFAASSGLAILCTALYAAHSVVPQVEVPVWVDEWIFGFGPIVLPAIAAACLSLVSVNDLHRRVARFRENRLRLEAARREAAFAQGWGALERVVIRVERTLLQEVFEWHSLTSFSESH